MKCKVIKDLLPLYAENLCSDESKVLVNEHLSTCSECKKDLENILKGIELPLLSEKEINKRLSEKDLLAKSKQSIQRDVFKKILIVINIISISLTILSVIIGIIFMFKGYSIKYPMFHYKHGINLLYFICFIIGLLPIFIGILELYRLIKKDRMQHYIRKFISNLLMQAVAVFLSLIITITMFIIVPPLESQTNNIKNYLNMDKDIIKYETVYNEFFPTQILQGAKNIEYHYEKYNSLFNTTAKIQFSMTLPETEYLTEKSRILDNYTVPIEGENNAFDIVLYKVRYPGKVKLEFRFDDISNKVIYNLYLDNN